MMGQKQVRDVMHQAFTLSTSLRINVLKAAEEMHARGIGSIILLDEQGTLAGIFTLRDVLRLVAQGGTLLSQPLLYAITPADELIVCSPDDTITSAGTKMAAHRIHHLPVLDQGKLVGILTQSDVDVYLLHEAQEAETELQHTRFF